MLENKKNEVINKILFVIIITSFLVITGLSQDANKRTCNGGELLRASQIIPISERPTPLDDPNTDDIVKAKREWDAWGKQEFLDREKWKDEAQVSCWTKLAKAGDKNLFEAFLRDAYLKNVNLEKVNLANANLNGANLSETKLIKADLTKANLSKADITNADLSGAILTNAIVSRKTTKGVDFDDWKKRGGKVIK